MAASLTAMSGATIAPSLPQMAEVFSDTPNADFLSRFILTVPALFIAIMSPIAGRLADRYGRLRLLFIGMAIYAIGGTTGLYVHNLAAILVGRALLGIAVGIVMTITITLVGDYYDGSERQKFMGTQSAFMALGGLVFVGIGGFLADLHWRAPFGMYFFSLAVLLMARKFLHEPERSSGTQSGVLPGKGITGTHLLIYATALLTMVFFYMVPVHLPFLLKESGFDRNALAGLAIAVAMVGGITSSLSYGRIRTHISYMGIYAGAFTLFAAGYVLVYLSGAYWHILAGMLLTGLGAGITMPNGSLWLLAISSPERRGAVMGLLSAALFIGQFASPLAAEPVKQGFGIKGAYLASAGGILIMALVYLALILWKPSGKNIS